MDTPRTYQTEAIVIKQSKLGEFDKILTVYTPEFGKLKAVAKGACRPKSKLGGNVEPLTFSLMYLARGRNLDIVTQSQIINGFPGLKNDLWRMACGLYILELIDSFTLENSKNRLLFDFLVGILDQLSKPDNNEIILRYFELQLFHYLGYRPQLHYCVGCDSPVKPVVNFFSPSQGGVLCPHCNSEGTLHWEQADTGPFKPSFPLSVDALKVLRLWQNCDYPTAKRVRVKAELSSELEQVLRKYIRYLLQREVKSIAWLEELKKSCLLTTVGKETKIAQQ